MKRIFLLFFSLFIAAISTAQEYTTSVKHYTLDDGLSHNQVFWLHKDIRGIVWVGTANGINLYDGASFKKVADLNFFHTKNENILEDHEGDLWLNTGSDKRRLIFFNIYSKKIKTIEEKFGKTPPIDSTNFYQAIQLPDSTIFISGKDGQLISYNITGAFESVDQFKNTNVKLRKIPNSMDFWAVPYIDFYNYAIPGHFKFQFEKICLYTTSQSGKIKNKKTIDLLPSNTKSPTFTEVYKLKLSAINGSYLTIDTFQNKCKFYSLSPRRTPFTNQYTPDLFNKTTINLETDILSLFTTDKETVQLNPQHNNQLEIDMPSCALLLDEMILLGNRFGLYKIQVRKSPFKKWLYKDPMLHNQSELTSVRTIHEHIKVEGMLDFCLDSIPKGVEFKKIWAHYKDYKNTIWFAKGNTIYKLPSGRKQLIRTNFSDVFLRNDKKQIYQFYEDQMGQVWVPTSIGLFLVDFDKESAVLFAPEKADHFFPLDKLRCIYQDKNGIYWIGSYNGLIRWDKTNNRFKIFTTKDGLSDNHIMGIYEDDYGFLWLSSDNGIMQFEKSTKRIKVYLPEDGISHREFNRCAHFQDPHGNIYFGSLNGITSFHPKDFVDRFYEIPDIPLIMTECAAISGKSGNQENRMKSFINNNKITLQAHDRFLQLKFALLDYHNSNPNLIKYTYSIDGEEDIFSHNNQINFNGLDYGMHHLTVKGRSGNGLFSKQTLNIPIEVLKPFYLQTWFLIFAAILFFGLLFLLQKIKTRTLRVRQEALESQVRQRTATIQTQKEELLELDKAKSRFLANISHEFRTPLTLILNSLDKKQFNKIANIPSDEQAIVLRKKEADILRRNSKRLQQLINQLLDLAKMESKAMQLNEQPNNLATYTLPLIQSYLPLAEKKKIVVQIDVELSQPLLYFDRDKIEKIISNLLSNAIKFTPKEGTIHARLHQEENNTIFEIKDSGIGIPQEKQKLIFDRFYQVNENYNHEGTGLGLALVKELVEVHNGKIEFTSTEGEGSTFRIELPLKKADSSLVIEAKPIEHSNFINIPNNKQGDYQATISENELNDSTTDLPILLLIEDNEDLLYHYQHSFNNEYQLLLAKNGEEGLKMAFEKLPDLIISDIMMPEKNGYEVCEILKSDERTNHIPIILLTAKVEQKDKIIGLSHGANEYMTKPYSQEELALRMRNLLKHRKIAHQKYNPSIESPDIPKKPANPGEAFILKCQNIIDEQLTDRNFGVEQLSKEVGMSRIHLFRKLKSITGQTPTHFIRSHRLEKAKKLLLEFEQNGTTIAYLVGFNNPNYFFKCFKDEYGMTVGQFLEQHVTQK